MRRALFSPETTSVRRQSRCIGTMTDKSRCRAPTMWDCRRLVTTMTTGGPTVASRDHQCRRLGLERVPFCRVTVNSQMPMRMSAPRRIIREAPARRRRSWTSSVDGQSLEPAKITELTQEFQRAGVPSQLLFSPLKSGLILTDWPASLLGEAGNWIQE